MIEETTRDIDSELGLASPKPLFEQAADATLDKVRATYAQRGREYSDSWAEGRFLALRAVAREMEIELTVEEARKLAAAALFDVKYARLGGGFKEDSLIDGIAYGALLTGLMARE